MKKIITFLNKRSPREWGVFFFVVSAAILSAVFISQKFGFHPCKLCIWQRWPYTATGVLSLVLIAAANNKTLVKIVLALLGASFAVGMGIAIFHTGVEYRWWEFHSDCTGGAYKAGASVDEFLARLKAAPAVRCDQRQPFLFGMTMAFYNALTSAGLVLAALFALYSQRSNSLSQYK